MTNSKRWAVFSRNTFAKTGTIKTSRTFASRDAAREFKRTKNFNYGIYDTVNMTVVR